MTWAIYAKPWPRKCVMKLHTIKLYYFFHRSFSNRLNTEFFIVTRLHGTRKRIYYTQHQQHISFLFHHIRFGFDLVKKVNKLLSNISLKMHDYSWLYARFRFASYTVCLFFRRSGSIFWILTICVWNQIAKNMRFRVIVRGSRNHFVSVGCYKMVLTFFVSYFFFSDSRIIISIKWKQKKKSGNGNENFHKNECGRETMTKMTGTGPKYLIACDVWTVNVAFVYTYIFLVVLSWKCCWLVWCEHSSQLVLIFFFSSFASLVLKFFITHNDIGYNL